MRHRPHTDHANLNLRIAIPDFKPRSATTRKCEPKTAIPKLNRQAQFATDSSRDSPEVATREFEVSGREPKSFVYILGRSFSNIRPCMWSNPLNYQKLGNQDFQRVVGSPRCSVLTLPQLGSCCHIWYARGSTSWECGE